MENFCWDWATIVDSTEHTSNAQKTIITTLFYMMDSPHWRPHIPNGKWKLLEYYPSVPCDCQPLRRCLWNPGLVTAISGVTDPDAVVLWPKILWWNYEELTTPVQEALKNSPEESHRYLPGSGGILVGRGRAREDEV